MSVPARQPQATPYEREASSPRILHCSGSESYTSWPARRPIVGIRHWGLLEVSVSCKGGHGHAQVKPPAECKGYSDVDARIQRRFVPGALAAAAMLDDEKTLRKILSEHGDFKESTTANGFRPMHVAAQKNCMTALKTLVAVKCDLDAPSKGGQTPLHVAAKEGSETAVQLLSLRQEQNFKFFVCQKTEGQPYSKFMTPVLPEAR